MTRLRLWLTGACLAAFGAGFSIDEARAQNPNSTTVQLPTYNFFTTQTSVSVPDRGGTYLGGVNRGATGSQQFGPPFLPGNRGLGNQASGGGMQVNVQIHDLEAMDAALLAQPSDYAASAPSPGREGFAGGNAAVSAAGGRAEQAPLVMGRAKGAGYVGGGESGGKAEPAAPNSLSALRDEKARRMSKQALEVEAILADGERAAREGKRGAAKIYYKQALRKADSDQQRLILDRLAALDASASTGGTASAAR